MSGGGHGEHQEEHKTEQPKDAPYTWVSKTAEAPFRAGWWTIKNTARWVRNSVFGVLKGAYTATLGTVGGALYGAGKQIGQTAHEVSNVVNESAHKFSEAPNVAKIGPVISGILGVTRKLIFGTLGIPVKMAQKMIQKPLEGGAQVLSGINPLNAIRGGGGHAKSGHAATESHSGGH